MSSPISPPFSPIFPHFSSPYFVCVFAPWVIGSSFPGLWSSLDWIVVCGDCVSGGGSPKTARASSGASASSNDMASGVLIVQCLQRAIWGIILEQRQCSGTYTHGVQGYMLHTHMEHIPLYTLFALFLLLFLPFWASSFHKWCICCPSPIWNGPCMNFESSPLWALLRRQGVGSIGAVAS